jgi:hypothetical protein
MKNGFGKKWDTMTVSERIDHLLASWKTVSDTSDPVILRGAAAVAYHVLKQAQSEIEQIKLCEEERVANLRSYDVELREQITQTRSERDEARREVCQFESRLDREYGNIDPSRFSPVALAADRGWDCFQENTR